MSAADLVEVEPDRWDALVRRLGVTDAYYTRGYVEASAPLAGGRAVFLHLPGDAIFPCILREDPVDVVTPYGYGGPLLRGAAPEAFAAAYEAWCARRGVVSTFAVLHPLFGNDAFRTAPLAGTVVWRLGGDLLGGMHAHHRRLVRRAERAGLVATVDTAPASLEGFVAMYEATMRRAGAAPFYLFGAAYWEALLRDVPLVSVDVRDAGGNLVAGVLGMGEPPWLHYHLGAMADAGRGTGAAQLALLELARHGRAGGHEILHLGGGVGGRADSLLEYKRRFAPGPLLAAHVGRAVHDRAAYAGLTGSPEVDWEGFFPAYRAPR